MDLTLKACRAPGIEADKLGDKTVYLRRPNGLGSIQYQDAVANLKLDEIENSSEQGLLFTACVAKYFVVTKKGQPFFGDLTPQEMVQEIDNTILDGLYGLVMEKYLEPTSLDDAAKNS